jgi:large subunit ribosomal protein L2
MGKNLIQQARGKGGPTYRAPSFKYKGSAKNKALVTATINGEVVDICKCRGHSAPLLKIAYEDGDVCIAVAPEGVKVGDKLAIGDKVEVRAGNIAPLRCIPDGTLVYNIESSPGDGGKFCRSSGTFAKVLAHIKEDVLIQLPSKKQKTFTDSCRATIGMVAGSGRIEKPFLKAGSKYYYMKARNKLWPKVSGNAQNAVDHPFGTSRSQRKSKARPAPRNAPPGRKVGMIRPSRSGRKKR